MSYKLDFRYEPAYLYVRATGIRSVENIASLALDYIKACEKHGYNKVLLDVRKMTEGLSTMDAYNLGTKVIERIGGPHPEVKQAVIDLEEKRENFHFVETVLVNRGFNLRFFSKVADAQRWLLESEDIST